MSPVSFEPANPDLKSSTLPLSNCALQNMSSLQNRFSENEQYFLLLRKLSGIVLSGGDITPCKKIDKPLVVYRLVA